MCSSSERSRGVGVPPEETGYPRMDGWVGWPGVEVPGWGKGTPEEEPGVLNPITWNTEMEK